MKSDGQGTLNQGFTEAFAAGASGIALRGLTVGGTLTLLDSERMVAYPLSDDGQVAKVRCRPTVTAPVPRSSSCLDRA